MGKPFCFYDVCELHKKHVASFSSLYILLYTVTTEWCLICCVVFCLGQALLAVPSSSQGRPRMYVRVFVCATSMYHVLFECGKHVCFIPECMTTFLPVVHFMCLPTHSLNWYMHE